MYWGEWSLSWLLPSFPSLQDPSHCSSGGAPPRPAETPASPAPEPGVARAPSRLGLGLSGHPARAAGCWPRGRGWPEGRVVSSACSPGCLESPTVRCLSSLCPGGTRCQGLRSPAYTSQRWPQLAAPRALLFSKLQAHGGGGAGCPPLPPAQPSSGPGRTWAAAARRRRGWASSTCFSAHWPRGSGRAGRRWRAPCAPGDAVLTRLAPPRCILIPGHCGRCTPSGKPLAGVARWGTHCTDVLGVRHGVDTDCLRGAVHRLSVRALLTV